jgi:hypothetical protein
MIMVPNDHQSSTFSTWVSHMMCSRFCSSKRAIDQVLCEGETVKNTIQWARPLRTTINSSQTCVKEEGGALKSIIRPTSFQVVQEACDDADNESLDSTIGYADTESIESENSCDLGEEAMSRHLDGDGRQAHLSNSAFEDADNSIVETENCNPRRAWSTSGTLRLNPTARILEDDESSQSSCSYLTLPPSGSNLESASNWSTSSSIVRSPAASRVEVESSQLTGRSSRNLRTRSPHWTDREEETIYASNYLSRRKNRRERASANSVSSSVLPSPIFDTYDSEESSKSSCSTFVHGEPRDPHDQDFLKADKEEARRSIRELSQSIRTPVKRVPSSNSGIEVLAAKRGDVTTCITGELVSSLTTPRSKLVRPPTSPRRSTTSQFQRTANHFRLIEEAKVVSETLEIGKKMAPPQRLFFRRVDVANQRHHRG